jgi:ABC-type nitrate/sulfonate/bicarbonate transport system substrate-binding protein
VSRKSGVKGKGLVSGIFVAFLGGFAIFAQLGLLFAAQSGPTKITVGYGGELGYQAPIWIAHDLKLFAKHGMTSELVRIAGGARSTAALLSDALQLSQSAGVAPVQANLAGGDLVIIATSTNRPTVSIVGQPKTVKKPQDLIGKKVGLVGLGEMNTFFFFNALERWGIDPKSVTILSIPGTQPRLAAIIAGAIDATVLAPPFSFEAEKYNLTQLANFAAGTDPFPQSGLVVRKELLRSNRDLVKRMLMAYVEAIHTLKTDEEKSLPIMKKYMRITDDGIAKRSYEYYSKLFSMPPFTDEKGVGAVLKFLATQPGSASAKNAKPEEFFDNSLMQELQREGFFARLK